MKKKSFIRTVSFIAALALALTACGNNTDQDKEKDPQEVSEELEQSQDGQVELEKADGGEKEAMEEYDPQKDQVDVEPYIISIRSGKREAGTQGDVIVVYDPAQEEKVMTSVEGPELIAGEDEDYQLSLADDFTGTISLGAGLKEVRIIGGITVDIDRGETEDFAIMLDGESVGTIKTKAKNMVISTAGEHDIKFIGSADELNLEANGNNQLDLLNFKAKDVNLQSFGDSQISLNAEDKLKVTADGKSLIQYTGQAKVEKDLSDNAKVEEK